MTTNQSDAERLAMGLSALETALRSMVEAALPSSAQDPLWGQNSQILPGTWPEQPRPKPTPRPDPQPGQEPSVGSAQNLEQLLQAIEAHTRVMPAFGQEYRAMVGEIVRQAGRVSRPDSITRRQADRALDTMAQLAQALNLDQEVGFLIGLLDAGDGHQSLPYQPTLTDFGTQEIPVVVTVAEPADQKGSLGPRRRPDPKADSTAKERPDHQPGAAPGRKPVEGSRAALGPTPGGGAVGVDAGAAVGSGPGSVTARGLAPFAERELGPGIRSCTTQSNGVVAYLAYRDAFNLALASNRATPLTTVAVVNTTDTRTKPVTLSVVIDAPGPRTDEVTAQVDIQVGPLGPGELLELPATRRVISVDPAVFGGLNEAVMTTIRLGLDAGEAKAWGSGVIRLLAANEWWAMSVPEAIAAFVRPEDPAIDAVLRAASQRLEQKTGSASLNGYESGPERVMAIAAAIYDALASRRLLLSDPAGTFEGSGQRIRTHWEVLHDRRGTCLDLTCIYTAALERAGIHPVIAVTADHAFAGFLTEDAQLPVVAVEDKRTLASVAASRRLVGVEATALCLRFQALTFEQASTIAAKHLQSGQDQITYLVDVHAAHGVVKPLPIVGQLGQAVAGLPPGAGLRGRVAKDGPVHPPQPHPAPQARPSPPEPAPTAPPEPAQPTAPPVQKPELTRPPQSTESDRPAQRRQPRRPPQPRRSPQPRQARRPLPPDQTSKPSGPPAQVPPSPPPAPVPPSPPPAPAKPPASASIAPDAAIPSRVQAWQRALVDSSDCNPLTKRRSGLTVPLHLPAAGLGRLGSVVAAGRPVKLLPKDSLAQASRPGGGEGSQMADGGGLIDALEVSGVAYATVSKGAFAARLRSLDRRSRLAMEETSQASLYLALGALQWMEADRQGRGDAPLCLVPVDLTESRSGQHFEMVLDPARRAVPNLCLAEKLRTVWGLEIPALAQLTGDEGSLEVEQILEATGRAIAGSRFDCFRVEPVAYLICLQTHTMDIWHDLSMNWSHLSQREPVHGLALGANQTGMATPATPSLPEAGEFASYLPLAADSGQAQAVRWAAGGHSFVLEGPPGTGKSQTITNLIAHCLVTGKSVLFVAQKQTALDVVKRRLDSVGLAPFCLDLYGRHQTVAAVIDQLRRAIEFTPGTSPGWDVALAAQREEVAHLSQYPQRLHSPGPMGKSVWQAHQDLLGAAAVVETRGPDPVLTVGPEVLRQDQRLAAVVEAGGRLAQDLGQMGGLVADSPWRLVGANLSVAGQVDTKPADAGLERRAAQPGLDLKSLAQAVEALGEVASGLEGPVWQLACAARDPAGLDALAQWLDTIGAKDALTPRQVEGIGAEEWLRTAEVATKRLRRLRIEYKPLLEWFDPEVIGFEWGAVIGLAHRADSSRIGKARMRREIVTELEGYWRDAENVPLKQLTEILQGAERAELAVLDVEAALAALPGIDLPKRWNPYVEADYSQVEQSLWLAERAVRAGWLLRGNGLIDQATFDQAAEQVRDQAGHRARGWSARDVKRTAEVLRELFRLLDVTPERLEQWRGNQSLLDQIVNRLDDWQADLEKGAPRLAAFLRVRRELDRLAQLGVQGADQVLDQGAVDGGQLDEMIQAAIAQATLVERLDGTGLRGFDPVAYQGRVDRFITQAADLRQRLCTELPARIVAARNFDGDVSFAQIGELFSQLARRRGGLTFRQLLEVGGQEVRKLVPCFLMSPASVARYLPGDLEGFDVVVFDEASQIRVPEAIGAAGRGQAVVVVGDSKQAPASIGSVSAEQNASDPASSGREEASLVPAAEDSILVEAARLGWPKLDLTWHYRSLDESLLAFSNTQYYGGRLATFPSPPADAGAPRGVVLRRVTGTWENDVTGVGGVNRSEAYGVVHELRDQLASHPQWTFGVVAFSDQQRDLILDLLDEVRVSDARLDSALSRTDAPLFVKNLDSVQGDERDVIIMTLAVAPDGEGRAPSNWGLLTRVDGERWLNVAVTRARRQVVVLTSFDPTGWDLSGSSSLGLAHLKDYLLAAEHGQRWLVGADKAPQDLHQDQVAAALRAAGLEVVENYGLSSFRVDLAVRREGSPSWVAVMLDGPNWARRPSVGDRDGLPAWILAGQLDWLAVHRIWLPAWLKSPQSEVEAIVRLTNPDPTPPISRESELSHDPEVPPPSPTDLPVSRESELPQPMSADFEPLPESEVPQPPPTDLPLSRETELPHQPSTDLPLSRETEVLQPVPAGFDLPPESEVLQQPPTDLPVSRESEVSQQPPTDLPVSRESEVSQQPPTDLPVSRESELSQQPPADLPVSRESELPHDPEVSQPSPTDLPISRESELSHDLEVPPPSPADLPVSRETELSQQSPTDLPVSRETELPHQPSTDLPLSRESELSHDAEVSPPSPADLPLSRETELPHAPGTSHETEVLQPMPADFGPPPVAEAEPSSQDPAQPPTATPAIDHDSAVPQALEGPERTADTLVFKAAAEQAGHRPEDMVSRSKKEVSPVGQVAIAVVSEEGPVVADRLIRIVAARFGIGQMTDEQRKSLRKSLPVGLLHAAQNGDSIAWPAGVDPPSYAGFRVPGDRRQLDEIPYHELRNAMIEAVCRDPGKGRDETFARTASAFGVQMDSEARQRLDGVLEGALREGRLAVENGLVTETEQPV